jgi:DNA-binding PadR family transcriptional regulator
MSSPALTPVSYVVLGLIARDGPSTPYTLKAAVARGIANFWPFPHSQIYSETEYLTGLGLLAEEREADGRRRRTFRLTADGRRALESWLREPSSDPVHIRSFPFLKLYFGYFGRPEDVLNLANVQIASLEAQQAGIRQMIERLRVRADRKWQMALAKLYSRMSLALVEGWQDVAATASKETRSPAARRSRRRR